MRNVDNDMPGFIGIHLGEMKLVFMQKFKNRHQFFLCVFSCVYFIISGTLRYSRFVALQQVMFNIGILKNSGPGLT